MEYSRSAGAVASISFGVLDLLEPVETHRLHDAAVDHDDARFVLGIAVEVLMHAIGRDVDEIALAPFEALGLLFPAELHLVIAIETHIPMQVVAIAFDNVEDLFREMTMLAGGFAGGNELLVKVQAAFLGVHLLIDDVFDETVG